MYPEELDGAVLAKAQIKSAMRPSPSVDDTVIAAVEQEIRNRRLQSGGRLPTERTFAEQLCLSRNAVRRGLARLEAEGRVTRHVGRGTFVATSLEPGSNGGETSPAEIMVVREMVEPEIVGDAALSATATDMAEMARCLAGGDTAERYDDFEAWDAALHRSFAVATHNNLLLSVADVIEEARHHPGWGSLKRRSLTSEMQARYRREHREIVEALAERDSAWARKATREHLRSVRSALLGIA